MRAFQAKAQQRTHRRYSGPIQCITIAWLRMYLQSDKPPTTKLLFSEHRSAERPVPKIPQEGRGFGGSISPQSWPKTWSSAYIRVDFLVTFIWRERNPQSVFGPAPSSDFYMALSDSLQRPKLNPQALGATLRILTIQAQRCYVQRNICVIIVTTRRKATVADGIRAEGVKGLCIAVSTCRSAGRAEVMDGVGAEGVKSLRTPASTCRSAGRA